MVNAIRVIPGTLPTSKAIAAGTHYSSLGEAIQAEFGIPDGLDPWIKDGAVYVGPDDIGPLKKTMDRMRDADRP